MTRQEIIEKAYVKAKEVVDRMANSNDPEDIYELIKVNSRLSLEINCIRNVPISGSALEFQVYGIVNGKLMDGCTTAAWNISRVHDDIQYLLRCYSYAK